MSVVARRMRMAAAGVPSTSFNPLTGISWMHAYWAADPLWSNPGDGNAVSSWRDGAGSYDLGQGTASMRPLYRAADATMNNQPTVDFDGSNDYMFTSEFTQPSFPYTLVCIGLFSATTGNRHIFGGWQSAQYGGSAIGINTEATTQFRFVAQGSIADGNANTNPHLFRGMTKALDDAGSCIAVDESVTTGTISHDRRPKTCIVGAYPYEAAGSDNPANVTIAFAGLYDGNVTASAGWASFKTWAATTYGLTIA